MEEANVSWNDGPTYGSGGMGTVTAPPTEETPRPPISDPGAAPPPTTPPAPPGGGGGWRIPAAIVVAAALLAGGYGVGRAVDDGGTDADQPSVEVQVDPENRPSEPPLTGTGEEPVAAVAAALSPAVVQLEVGQGLGSGVIYDPNGLILTAAHVVVDADEVDVRLADGRVVDGEVLGASLETDIAVVSIEPLDNMPVATLAGEQPDVGELAVAVGSPFALDQTVTSGVVSAIDRPFPTPGGGVVNTIQTDAPINPGNSGGPLANRNGEVIGIATAIESSTGVNAGVGFAIPIDLAEQVADRIVSGEPLEFGYLGVRSQPAEVDGTPGAQLLVIEDGSPADDAGLEPGDVVTAIDGEPVVSSGAMAAEVRSRQPGDTVDLTVLRDGEETTVEVELGAAPSGG